MIKHHRTHLLIFLGIAIAVLASYAWLDRPMAKISFDVSRAEGTAWVWYAANDISSFGSSSLWISAFALLLAFSYVKPRYRMLAISGFAATILSSLLVRIIKLVASRARPSKYYNEDVYGFFWSFDLDYSSFPSGHATTIAAAMMCLGLAYPKKWPVWLAIALIISLARVVAAKHYLGDVLAGAYLGAMVAWMGWQVIQRYQRKQP